MIKIALMKAARFFYPVITFAKKNAVLCIAITAAVLTMFFVPPDREYITYIDFKTLTCLFCTLAVVCALRNIYFFRILANKIVCVFKNTRSCILAIVYITFIGSMLIANDMALITFLPLGYYVLSKTSGKKYLAFTCIMQNIAANLGGMLTPFGNPQNLYLYTYYNIADSEFFKIMFPPFILATIGITLCCLFVKKEPLEPENNYDMKLPALKTIIYVILFVLSITIVFRIIPYYIGLVVIFIFIFFMDRNALKQVDYGLLFTFVAFFIFSSNMARIDSVSNLLSTLVSQNPLLAGVISCQFISNVPTAVLLCRFTDDFARLLVAVNIGGAGTLVASLASLITFKEFIKYSPKEAKKYLYKFTIYNFSFLISLTVIMLIWYK